MTEVREQVSFACGCVVYRDHATEGDPIIIPHPCERHATITRLPIRVFNRFITWPPDAGMLDHAARRGEPYAP